jgi:hypothetical protein
MREGTTSRVMAADRLYGEFYDFYSVRPEYFGFTLLNFESESYRFECGIMANYYKMDCHGIEFGILT